MCHGSIFRLGTKFRAVPSSGENVFRVTTSTTHFTKIKGIGTMARATKPTRDDAHRGVMASYI